MQEYLWDLSARTFLPNLPFLDHVQSSCFWEQLWWRHPWCHLLLRLFEILKILTAGVINPIYILTPQSSQQIYQHFVELRNTFFNVVPSNEETSFSTTFYGLYFSYYTYTVNNGAILNFNSCLNYWLGVVQGWYKSIFRIKVQEPYPQPSSGQKLGVLEVLPDSTVTCIKGMPELIIISY